MSSAIRVDETSEAKGELPTWNDGGPVGLPQYGDTEVNSSTTSDIPQYINGEGNPEEDEFDQPLSQKSRTPSRTTETENGSSGQTTSFTEPKRPRRSQHSGSSPSSGLSSKDRGSGDAASDLIQQFQEVYVAGHATGYERGYQARSDDQSLSELLVRSAVGSLPTFFYYTALPPILGMAAKVASSTVSSCLGSVASSVLSSK